MSSSNIPPDDKNHTSTMTFNSSTENGTDQSQARGSMDFNPTGAVASQGQSQIESNFNNPSSLLHKNNFQLQNSGGQLPFSPSVFQQGMNPLHQQGVNQRNQFHGVGLSSTAYATTQNQSMMMRSSAGMSSLNGHQQPVSAGARDGQNPLAVPAWTGSVNPADFAFSMSEKEIAELNRFRKGNTSAGGNIQSPVSTTNVSDRSSFNTNNSNPVAQSNNTGASVINKPSTESNSLGLQNASTVGVPNVANTNLVNPVGLNNNLTYQQMQRLIMNGSLPPNSMNQHQQMIIQQNLQRQAMQKNQQMMQNPNMMPQAGSMQQRSMLNNFGQTPSLLPQQYQQQQTQQLMMNSATRNPTATVQGNIRPGMNSLVMSNQSIYQQQQMALLNQQQLLMQGQRTQRIQTMNTFEGTSHAVFNERVHFEKHFATYMAQLGLPSPPIIMGSMIDVFMLFHAVYQAKGFEAVNRANGWGMICQRVGLDASPSTQATIFQYYQKSMLPLENNLKKGVVPTDQANGIQGSTSNLNSIIPQAANGMMSSPRNIQGVSTPITTATVSETPKVDTGTSGGTEAFNNDKSDQVPGINGSGLNKNFDPMMSASSTGAGSANQRNGSADEPEVDDNRYHPKVRYMKGLGGIDQFRELFQLSSRYKPSKEIYGWCNIGEKDLIFLAPRNYHLLDLCIRSDLPSHIRFGLDMLVCVSSEFGINFSDCREFFKVFLLFFKEQLEKGFPVKKENDFKTYAELFEAEMNSCWQLQSNCVSSLDPISQTAQYAAACGLVLRNCSFTLENQRIMAENPLFIQLILQCLDLSSPSGDELGSHHHLSSSYPKALEHRKNGLICLSNMGYFIEIPDAESASLIIRVCNDFIGEDSGTYRYTALSAIAKLLVNEANQKVFDQACNRLDLVQTLLKLFPWTGYQLSPATFQVWTLSEWEFAMTVLTVLITPDTGPYFIEDLLGVVPDVDRIMFNLYKRPQPFGMRATPIELVHQFTQLRERALRILFVVIRSFRQGNRIKHAAWERKLLEASTSALNEADAWSVPVLHEFLSQEYAQSI